MTPTTASTDVYNSCTPRLSALERQVLNAIDAFTLANADELCDVMMPLDPNMVAEALDGMLFDGYAAEGPGGLELTEKGQCAVYGIGAWGQS